MSRQRVLKRQTRLFDAAMCAIVLALSPGFGQTVKRGRNEGTLAFPASNVMGNGNITAHGGAIVAYGAEGARLDPAFGARVGLGDIMQLSGYTVPLATGGIGPTQGRLQLTLPGNNTLRFIGASINANLFLSASQDTISGVADTGKPVYNPYLFGSGTIDFDFLSLWKSAPLKIYAGISLADSPRLLYRYNQLAVQFGGEWKMLRHSVFSDFGIGLFKEKRSRSFEGDPSYRQWYFWLQPGLRYRLFDRFSIMGGVKISLYQKAVKERPVTPDLFGITLKSEIPLFFKETNTEAIRTLIFMEQQKQDGRAHAPGFAAGGERTPSRFDASLFDTGKGSGETFDYTEEKEDLIKRRSEIQEKMQELEKLLEEDGDEDL